MKTVADQVAETLAAAGVKRIYGIVGDSLNDLTDAIPRQTKIEWMHVPHEEVADLAAGAEAHLTGEFAVCAGSCRPDNLYFVEFEQKSTGLLGFGTELNNPNFAAMAQASGIRGIRLTHPAAVDEGIPDALAHDGLVLTFNHPRKVKGFSLYMVQAIVNSRADELVDLAKTDLWH